MRIMLSLMLFLIGSVGCVSQKTVHKDLVTVKVIVHNQPPAVTQKLPVWTIEQGIYLALYKSYVRKVAADFHLKPNASIEDFRPHIAKKCDLPETASFDDILQSEKAKKKLTEELRLKILTVFGSHLSPDVTWKEIILFAEKHR